QGGASYGLAARPPAHFSWLLDVPEITTTENKNQTEKPFTQNPLQNPARRSFSLDFWMNGL
ncbi:MAG TPA: hypothetical protein VGY56_08955, partial [Verrucomicrobiae bacterium]|nr:hypothetical protein [Verrucomicrobiae bacterium]